MSIEGKLRSYYITTVASVLFAVIGFSYNAWRLEVSEDNSNIRTAAFQVLVELADFEQVLYAGFYDGDNVRGSPRMGWVKVGLIKDLSVLISPEVQNSAKQLQRQWQTSWQQAATSQAAVDQLVAEVDSVRNEIQRVLVGLN